MIPLFFGVFFCYLAHLLTRPPYPHIARAILAPFHRPLIAARRPVLPFASLASLSRTRRRWQPGPRGQPSAGKGGRGSLRSKGAAESRRGRRRHTEGIQPRAPVLAARPPPFRPPDTVPAAAPVRSAPADSCPCRCRSIHRVRPCMAVHSKLHWITRTELLL